MRHEIESSGSFRVLRSGFFKESFLLSVNVAIVAALGFAFWLAASWLAPPNQVGVATTLIVLMDLVSMISLLGLNMAVVKYLGKGNAGQLVFSSALTTVGIASLFISLIASIGLLVVFPSSTFGITAAILFFATAVSWTAHFFLDAFLISICRSELILVKTLGLYLTKLALLYPLSMFGGTGIFLAWAIASWATIILFIGYLLPHLSKYSFAPTLDFSFLRDHFGFTALNFGGEILRAASAFIPSFIAVLFLGPASAAYVYLCWNIAGIFYGVTYNIGLATVSGSKSASVKGILLKEVIANAFFSLPALAFLLIFGSLILSFFGPSYSANGFPLLQVLAIALLPYSVNNIFASYENAIGRGAYWLMFHLVSLVVTLSLSFFLVPKYGILGIGLSWLASQLIANFLAMGFHLRQLLLKKTKR